MRHEQRANVHGGDKYVMDTLGAPFKVTLLDGVTVNIDPETGKELVTIVDVVGLIGAVVRTRVQHPRKLSGAEIKFIRDALNVRAKALAEFLGMTPEHISRCENGSKVMSAANEKEFRLAAYLATFVDEPKKIFFRPTKEQLEAAERDLGDDVKEKALEFVKAFWSMTIEPVYAVDEEPLEFEFFRRAVHRVKRGSRNGDDDEWDTAA